jgi:endogenous inhibitor of DNA gyrase (YacG/DUF329 family)
MHKSDLALNLGNIIAPVGEKAVRCYTCNTIFFENIKRVGEPHRPNIFFCSEPCRQDDKDRWDRDAEDYPVEED